MNILFLTAELTDSATGYCAKLVAEELAKRGHIVHIVSAYSEEKESVECDGHLFVHEILGRRVKQLKTLCLKSSNSIIKRFGVLLTLIHKLLVQIKGIFSIIPLFDDTSLLYRKAASIIDTHRVDLIIPVVNPRESIIAANRLHKKYNVPYVPYYLDSIVGNIGFRILTKKWYIKRALKYEEKRVRDSKGIIMMQSIKGTYDNISLESYPYVSKISYLDIPLLTIQPKDPKEGNSVFLFDGQFSILFIGTMPNRVRDPRYVFHMADALAKDDIHFYFAGKSDYMNDLNELIDKNQNVHFLGQIEHSVIPNYVAEVDVLLNIGNSIKGMLPSKVFEYMSYQKPILSTIKHPNDLSIPYLKQYGAVHIIDETQPLQKNIDETQKFIQQVRSGEFLIKVSDLVKENGALYSNTPTCFCEKVEAIMSYYL